MIGKTILGYTVEEEIGSGGFGTVYKVCKKNQSGSYTRALKHISLPSLKQYNDVLNSMGGDYSKANDYFAAILNDIVHEIQILNDLTEKGVRNVVWYYENQIDEQKSPLRYDIYILMEYLTPFSDYILKSKLTLRDVIKMGKDILTALMECHRNNIIHRDIKEDNIFVTNNGTYKLGDFGVSKKLQDRSRAESMKGTPNYIAPEVYFGKEQYDKTVDIYSLGIVLYKLLNYNRNPFMPQYPAAYNSDDEDRAFEERMRGSAPPLPQNADEKLGQAVIKAILSKNDRYSSAKEFYDALVEAEATISNEKLNKELNKTIVKNVNVNVNDTNTSIKTKDKKSKALKETIGEKYDYNDEKKEESKGNGNLFETQGEDYFPTSSGGADPISKGFEDVVPSRRQDPIKDPVVPALQKNSFDWLLYITPVMIAIIYIVIYCILLPRSYDNTISLIDWAIKNPWDLLEAMKSSSNVMPHLYKAILLKVVNYVLFGGLIVSLYLVGRKLHFSKPEYAPNAAVLDKEAYYLALEVLEEVKSANIPNTKDVLESIKTIHDRLKNESGFGIGSQQVIRCENEIESLLQSIRNNISGLQNKSTFEASKQSIISSCRTIMSKMKLRSELKKR